MKALVPGLPNPSAAALLQWKELIAKSGEFTADAKLWQSVPRGKSGDFGTGTAELEWWSIRFADGSSSRKALFLPVKHLFALRAAEAIPERKFSVAGVVECHRESMSEKAHKALTHIRWHAQQLQRQSCKRRRDDDADGEADESDDAADVAAAEMAEENLAEEMLQEALELGGDAEAEATSSKANPFEGLAADAAANVIPVIAKAIDIPASDPLPTRVTALPALELLFEVHVTKRSLRQQVSLVQAVKRLSTDHTDPAVKLMARQLKCAWRLIFHKDGSTGLSTAAAAVKASD
jgi:hypothetical protein